jgi:hypothetical protein
MTDKEAMKLALEALELLTGAWQTFDALDYGDKAITALKERLAQPEQEPVAWKWRVKDFCDWPNWSVSLKRPADSGHAQYPRTEGYEDIPLYAHPPQRTERSGWRKKQIDDAEEEAWKELEKKNDTA